MAKNSIYFFILLFVCCNANKKIVGNYFKNGKDFKYSLTLNKDNTFILKEESFEANSQCQGRWHYLTKDTLLLECGKEDLPAMLQSGYISDRIQKAIILDHHQIKLQQVILTRKLN
jgi:hypothetical protein